MSGCGCKKNKQTTTPTTPKVTTTQTQKTNNVSIQESIRKVVEKYYKK
jgi:hypothetical protein